MAKASQPKDMNKLAKLIADQATSKHEEPKKTAKKAAKKKK